MTQRDLIAILATIVEHDPDEVAGVVDPTLGLEPGGDSDITDILWLRLVAELWRCWDKQSAEVSRLRGLVP